MKRQALDDMVAAILKNAVVLALTCAPIAAVAQQPGRYEGGRTVRVVTGVEAISQVDRRVALTGEDGTRLIVEAGPDRDESQRGEAGRRSRRDLSGRRSSPR